MKKSELKHIIKEEVLKEASEKRWNMFLDDSKHAQAIIKKAEKLGANNEDDFYKAVGEYFDKLENKLGVSKVARIADHILKDLGINSKKYDNKPFDETEKVISSKMFELYNKYGIK